MDNKEIIEKKFLKIKSIRTSSRAFQMNLKENDIIIGLDGEFVYSSYDVFSKNINNSDKIHILTLVRKEILFNTFISGSLGIIAEQIDTKETIEIDDVSLKLFFDRGIFYEDFEVYKKPNHTSILLNVTPSILASLAPPLWMIQNRLWILLGITIIFFMSLVIISPWLFMIGWILKSWYVGNAQIDILRFFYRFNNYRLWMSFCEDSEKTAQELARKFDEKVDFDYSYLEPATIEN